MSERARAAIERSKAAVEASKGASDESGIVSRAEAMFDEHGRAIPAGEFAVVHDEEDVVVETVVAKPVYYLDDEDTP